jgi:CheY-like chemotaxis protein
MQSPELFLRSSVHILVVEDEEAVRKDLIKLLRKEGHTVCWAACWDTGIAQMRREKPDVVLLDMTLPEMGGWRIALERFNDPELGKIPMIILSGTIDEDVRSQGFANVFAGGSVVVNEPYRPEKLIGAIEHLQGRKVRSRAQPR